MDIHFKFFNCIKAGIALYVGVETARILDRELGKRFGPNIESLIERLKNESE